MGFSSFDLFSDVGRQFVNPEIVRDVSSIRDVNSALQVAADNIFGLVPGGSSLARLTRYTFAGYGFLVDTITNERLAFQYNVVPSEDGGAEWNPQKTLGRSVPHLQYTGGKERQIILPITFSMKEFGREDVLRSMRWLQGLAYPDYDGQDEISLAPHPVVLVQGKLYERDIWVVRDYRLAWGDVLDPITQIPSEATCTLTLLEVSTRGKSRSEVIRL